MSNEPGSIDRQVERDYPLDWETWAIFLMIVALAGGLVLWWLL